MKSGDLEDKRSLNTPNKSRKPQQGFGDVSGLLRRGCGHSREGASQRLDGSLTLELGLWSLGWARSLFFSRVWCRGLIH